MGGTSISKITNSVGWIAIGFYNEIRFPEKRQGSDTYTHGGSNEFISSTDSAHLVKLPSLAGEFTWSNNPPRDNFRQITIDRAFDNQEWTEKWPNTRVGFFRRLMRDHASMTINFSTIQKGTRPFKVYNSWLNKPDFLSLDMQGISTPFCGHSLFGLQKKLRREKELVKPWAKEQVEETRRALDKVRSDILVNPNFFDHQV